MVWRSEDNFEHLICYRLSCKICWLLINNQLIILYLILKQKETSNYWESKWAVLTFLVIDLSELIKLTCPLDWDLLYKLLKEIRHIWDDPQKLLNVKPIFHRSHKAAYLSPTNDVCKVKPNSKWEIIEAKFVVDF